MFFLNLNFESLVVGMVGLFLGTRNLARSFRNRKKRGLFSRLAASVSRMSGCIFLVVGFIYLLSGVAFGCGPDEDEEDEE